jgi:ketosteroid isomerase-like protein
MQRSAVHWKAMCWKATLAGLGVCATASALAQASTAKAVPALTPAECEVWARELSFAQSVADHDAAAFASHIEPDAAFGAGLAQPTRGREAIARQWAPIVEGKRVRLVWYPTRTTIGSTPDVAWSSGPALFENPDPKAAQRYRLGGFHSVWRRGEDGVWRVMFDDGIEPVPATDEQVAAFHAGRQVACPQG